MVFVDVTWQGRLFLPSCCQPGTHTFSPITAFVLRLPGGPCVLVPTPILQGFVDTDPFPLYDQTVSHYGELIRDVEVGCKL